MVYNRLGITYQYLGDFPESLKNHFAALRLREETQNQSGIAASYNNMGMIYGHLGNTPQARHSYLAALKIEEKAGNKQGIAAAITNLATIERSEGNYADALTHLFASIALMEQTGNMHVVAVNYSHIGNVYAEQYKYDDALTYYGLSLDIQGPLNYKYGIVECLCNRGTVYFRQGKYTEALQDLLQSLALSEEMDAKDRMKECYQILSDCYEALGDLASALAYFKKYHEVQKEILGAEAHKKAAALHFQKEMELKEKELNFEKREKELNQKLLLNMLPAEVADELKNKGDSEPRHFEHATVMFTDFKNFTAYSEKWSAKDLIGELNACFSAFDEIIAKHHIEKIKTMGDGFIAASGLPIHNESHALNMVNAAIEIRDFMLDRKRNMGDRTFEIRIGIHSGKVVAGIVGISKYAYDIWGDTVNTASRMEQHSEGGKINISEITYELIKEAFHCKIPRRNRSQE